MHLSESMADKVETNAVIRIADTSVMIASAIRQFMRNGLNAQLVTTRVGQIVRARVSHVGDHGFEPWSRETSDLYN